MKKNHFIIKVSFSIFCLVVIFTLNAKAAGTLIQLSSVTYDGGNNDSGKGIAVDSTGNIFVCAQDNTNNDYITLKYDSDFNLLDSTIYDTGDIDYASDLDLDSSDNIVITGYYKAAGVNNYDYLTIKYTSDLSLTSTATYNLCGDMDISRGLAIDNQQNIIVTGSLNNGVDYDMFTIKYDRYLNTISSKTEQGLSGHDASAHDVTTDSNGNIIVAGRLYYGFIDDFYTAKYDSNFNFISSKNVSTGYADAANGVTTDSEDNIIVTGKLVNDSTSKYECFTVKYDKDFNIIKSHSYAYGDKYTYGKRVITDNQDNIIVCGYIDEGDFAFAFDDDLLILKYDKNMNLLSSYIYDSATKYSSCNDVDVDSEGNIFVACSLYNTDCDCCTIKFLGSPSISSISPSKGIRGETLDITVNGKNFYSGAQIDFSGSGITVNQINLENPQKLTANVTISQQTDVYTRNITLTNTDGCYATVNNAFKVTEIETESNCIKVKGGEKGYVNPSEGEKTKLIFKTSSSGTVQIKVYTKTGQLVWENQKHMSKGSNLIEWSCKNADNNVVASGIYIVYIKGPGIEETKKIAIVK